VEKDFISLSPETSALEAAKRMAREGHGYVIVANPGGDAIGIVMNGILLLRSIRWLEMRGGASSGDYES